MLSVKLGHFCNGTVATLLSPIRSCSTTPCSMLREVLASQLGSSLPATRVLGGVENHEVSEGVVSHPTSGRDVVSIIINNLI